MKTKTMDISLMQMKNNTLKGLQKQPQRNYMIFNDKPTINAIRRLLIVLKKDIQDEYRVSEFHEEDDLPGIEVTFATNNELSEWACQTGDNSYSGSCYFYRHWYGVYLYRRSNSTELARDILANLKDFAEEAKSYEKQN